jgi:hypothetical protein
MQKPVIVATDMLEIMIDVQTSTRAKVSDIVVEQAADAIMLSGEAALIACWLLLLDFTVETYLSGFLISQPLKNPLIRYFPTLFFKSQHC